MAFLGVAFLCSSLPTFAQSEEEMEILHMIYKDKDLVVTPTRSPKRIAQVAENITVISAAEIEAINAHSLADVLRYVTGVQVDTRGGPGSGVSALIQGSDPRHVQVMVDGISLNNLSDNFPEIGAFPVQQIERIEIIKGPASSAWGSSLGGIVNIITKAPDPARRFGGTVSASGGERGTGDFRADAAGTVAKLGYYLYGGGFTSDGLTANMPSDTGNLYGKLQLHATDKLQAEWTVGYARGARGDGAVEEFGFIFSSRNSFEQLLTTMSLNYVVNDALSLNLSGRMLKQRSQRTDAQTDLASGLTDTFVSTFDDTTWGGSTKVNWRSGPQNLLAGMDYDDGTLDSNVILAGRQGQQKWAFFTNDTLTFGKFSVTPGARYDHTSTNGDFFSPSIGLTVAPFEQTTLRGFVARGFNTPPLSYTFGDGLSIVPNPGLRAEEVWSYSVGMETALFSHFWFKATGFINDIDDVITPIVLPDGMHRQAVNGGRQRRQGVEVEMKTIPVHNVSLSAGYTLLDVRDRDTDLLIPGGAADSCDLGIDYNDNRSLKGALRGHYIRWNADPRADAKSSAVIWDLNLAKKIVQRDATAVELFFTAHNLFNGAQYSDSLFPNARRWFEGGARCKF
jgi:vitamin B12 transporter